MSDRSLTRLLRGLVVVGVLGTLTGLTALAVTERPTSDFASLLLVFAVLAVSFGAVVWIAARPQPRNLVVWILAAFVASLAVLAVGKLAMALIDGNVLLPLDNETQVPADLPAAVARLEGWTTAVSSAAFFSLLTFGLLLFPDGRLPSRRWRPVAVVLALGILAGSISAVLIWHPDGTVAPFAPDGPGHDFVIGNLFFFIGPLLSLAGLVVRYRRSQPSTRSQIKWILWGAVVMLPLFLIGSALGGAPVISMAGGITFVAAYGVAITKYRLYDVDVVISRTLVFGALAVFIGVVYVAVVVGVGALVGSADEPNTGLAIVATAIVAVAFQPVRRRMERVANRVVFGRKATPYEVLSEFSQRVAATSEISFDEAARSLTEGTRAERVVISIHVDGEVIEAAAWPAEPSDNADEVVRLPIEDEGLILGSLDLFVPAAVELGDDDRRLGEQLASGMGLALRNQLLTQRLAARVEDLRESRRRLVAVQDATRRKLERDLHDGAQQQLVALKVKLGLSRTIAEKDGAPETAKLLADLSEAADEAVDAMREFARGVYPPLLEAEGLGAAISAQARRSSIPISLETDGVGRYPRDVEATVYFCVLEALRNAAQHARASHASVSLSQSNGSLAFRVTDDGDGFEPAAHNLGGGLVTMTDRLDAISGTLVIDARPGHGTTISGELPVPAAMGDAP